MTTVLIADDHASNRDLMKTLLGYQGYRAIEAMDGAQGLALARAQRPDLVISDILMPKMNGFEFIRQLRADPKIAATPVIFYSAVFGPEDTLSLAQDCGFSQFLVKPSEPEAILKAIDLALNTGPMSKPSPPSDTFDRAHLELITNKLIHLTDVLEEEKIERKHAEEALQVNLILCKRIEKALRKSEEKFRALGSCSPLGMFLTDSKGQCTYANPRCVAIFGSTLGEVIGQGWTQFIHPEDGQRVLEAWRQASQAGKEFDSQYRWQRKNGVTIWVHARAAALYSDEGAMIGHVGTMENITPRKAIERMLQQAHVELERRVLERSADPEAMFLVAPGLEKLHRFKEDFR
jgi:PAS domain S-box-containing protein